jgi:hypothetical protein
MFNRCGSTLFPRDRRRVVDRLGSISSKSHCHDIVGTMANFTSDKAGLGLVRRQQGQLKTSQALREATAGYGRRSRELNARVAVGGSTLSPLSPFTPTHPAD